MSSKWLQKQLMGIGVQRNDAAGFVRAYRAIQKAQKAELCANIMNFPRPTGLATERANVRRLGNSIEVSSATYQNVGDDAIPIIKKFLCEGLVDAMLNNGAVSVMHEATPRGTVVFHAVVRVAVPEVHDGQG